MGEAGRRDAVWAVLRASTEPMSILDVARRLAVHPNTVRFHLRSLVEAGRVDRIDRVSTGPGRPPLLFQARHRMNPAGPRDYRTLAEILAGALAADPAHAADRATAAGREWGRQLGSRAVPRPKRSASATLAWLVERLDELGFAPRPRVAGGRREIDLRHCPFLDLTEHRDLVVCPAHLGLMQGAMSAVGSPLTVERLEPFAEPDVCRAHVARATARTGSS